MNKKSEKMEKLLSPTTLVKMLGNAQIDKSYVVKTDSVRMKTLVAEWVHHFKKDKWPLSYDHMIESLFFGMFGIGPMEYIVTSLKKEGISVGLGSKDHIGDVIYVAPKPKKSRAKKGKKKGKE